MPSTTADNDARWGELLARPFAAADLAREPEWLAEFGDRVPRPHRLNWDRFVANRARLKTALRNRAYYAQWVYAWNKLARARDSRPPITVGEARKQGREWMRLYPSDRPIRVGVVIGTHGAVPYVHLGLESVRRHGMEVAVLVHDDLSAERERLAALCREYGADFSCNADRLGHYRGDAEVFRRGLLWAQDRGCDVLVKFSRRWLPTHDWLPGLRLLAERSQAPTFASYDRYAGWGFRTEAMGMSVPRWLAAGAAERFERGAPAGMLFEAFADEIAVQVPRCFAFERYAEFRTLPDQHRHYAYWPLAGLSRSARPTGSLWHNVCPPADYHAMAAAWGLTGYQLGDFEGFDSAAGR